jgi:hypothetical protein
VVVLPKGRQIVVVPEPDENFSSPSALDMDVLGALFSWRGINVDTDTSLIVDFDHDEEYNLALGYGKSSG